MAEIKIPHRIQETDVYCGPAVVQMILAKDGTEISQNELAATLGTTIEDGTTAVAIERFLSEYGFTVVRKNNAQWKDIATALQAGTLVIVGFINPEDKWTHYAIVALIDNQEIRLVDPLYESGSILSRDEFLLHWRDDEKSAYGERMMMSISS